MHCTPQNDVLPSITVSDDKDNSDAIVFSGFTKGVVLVPNGSSITSLTYWISSTEDGTYTQLYNAGSAISTTVAANRVFALDSAIEGAAFLKLQGDAAGTVDLHLISS
jgi:hypothetical protein|tara:strand:+ start:137 stop:460 length:324 start_codon:yes stop_codon:yes gene_type:complete